MSTQRILLLSYIVLGVLVGMVLGHLISGVPSSVTSLSFLHREIFAVESFWSMTIGFVVAAGATIWCWVDKRVMGPAVQVVEELQRVTWPTFAETRTAAFAVIVATLICAALLGVFDSAWGVITSKIYATP